MSAAPAESPDRPLFDPGDRFWFSVDVDPTSIADVGDAMAVELASTGVRVNAVCPGAVNTPFLSDYHLPEDADMTLLQRSMSPMGGLVEAVEVAAAVAYLASDEAASVSGTTTVSFSLARSMYSNCPLQAA